jgi:hypothetical protein
MQLVIKPSVNWYKTVIVFICPSGCYHSQTVLNTWSCKDSALPRVLCHTWQVSYHSKTANPGILIQALGWWRRNCRSIFTITLLYASYFKCPFYNSISKREMPQNHVTITVVGRAFVSFLRSHASQAHVCIRALRCQNKFWNFLV